MHEEQMSSLELFGKPILVVQLSPMHVLCLLLLSHMLLVHNLLTAHALWTLC